MPAGWVSAAVGVYSAISGADSARQASNTAGDANQISRDQLAFQKQQYADQKPYIDQSQQLQLQTARDQASRSTQAWDQNQQATAGATTQMGLNSLGGQWLTPEQQQELLGLQQTMGKPTTAAKTATTGTGLTSDQQARLSALTQKQQTQSAPAAPTANAGPPPMMGSGAEAIDAYYNSPEYTNWANGTGNYGTPQRAAVATLSPAEQQELQQLQGLQSGGATPGLADTANDPALVQARTSAQARINELQNIANTNIQAAEKAKGQRGVDTAKTYADQTIGLGEEGATSILNDAGVIQNDLTTRGAARMGEQTGFFNNQASELQATAKQRAIDNELRGKTSANAAISNAAGQADRALLRVGGDPNKMAALGLDISNKQQLARISAGNQIAGINIGNLNAADDQARGLQATGFNQGTAAKYADENAALGVKSSSLDAARQSRMGAKQTALGINFDAAKTNDNYVNNSKDVADTKLNSLLQGSANFGQGFANTSATNANGSTNAAGQSAQTGQTGLNTLNNAASTAAGTLSKNAGNTGNASGAVSSGLGQFAAGAMDIYKNWNSTSGSGSGASYTPTSSDMQGLYGASASGYDNYSGEFLSDENAKEDLVPMDGEEALEGLSSITPKKYKYKKGRGDGGRHVHATAQDMNKQFGDRVAPNGKSVDIQSELGLQHAAIGALNDKLDRALAKKD